jgi:hypothetical protein
MGDIEALYALLVGAVGHCRAPVCGAGGGRLVSRLHPVCAAGWQVCLAYSVLSAASTSLGRLSNIVTFWLEQNDSVPIVMRQVALR